jgi:hypothetical protein
MQDKYLREWNLHGPPAWVTASYNIAPSQQVPIMRLENGPAVDASRFVARGSSGSAVSNPHQAFTSGTSTLEVARRRI